MFDVLFQMLTYNPFQVVPIDFPVQHPDDWMSLLFPGLLVGMLDVFLFLLSALVLHLASIAFFHDAFDASVEYLSLGSLFFPFFVGFVDVVFLFLLSPFVFSLALSAFFHYAFDSSVEYL